MAISENPLDSAIRKFVAILKKAGRLVLEGLLLDVALKFIFPNGLKIDWRRLGSGALIILAVIVMYYLLVWVVITSWQQQFAETASQLISPANIHVGNAIGAAVFAVVCWIAARRKRAFRYVNPAVALAIPYFTWITASETAAAIRYNSFHEVQAPQWDQFFDRESGKPTLWYRSSSRDSNFAFFNMPAWDLRPVNTKVRQQYFDKQKRNEEGQSQRKAQEAQVARTRELQSLFNPVSRDVTNNRVAVAILSEGSFSHTDAENKFIKELAKQNPDVLFDDAFLRSEFKTKGYFEKAFGGDVAFAKEAGILNGANRLLLCKLKVEDSRSVIDGTVSRNILLSYRAINRLGEPATIGYVDVTGPGMTSEEALDRGLELLVEKHGAELVSRIP